jgi:hypothetical protein
MAGLKTQPLEVIDRVIRAAMRAGVKSISVGLYRSCYFSAQGNITIIGVLSLAFLGTDHFTVPHERPWLLSNAHQRWWIRSVDAIPGKPALDLLVNRVIIAMSQGYPGWLTAKKMAGAALAIAVAASVKRHVLLSE